MAKKGFTLVEIMIVVAIIALLAAIAIPNLLRARISAQEAAAVGAMRTILTAETQWRVTNLTYTTLANFGSTTPPYIDSSLANGTKLGYNFAVYGPTATQFWACATHQAEQGHSYYIDEEGMLCTSAEIGEDCPVEHKAPTQRCPGFYFSAGL